MAKAHPKKAKVSSPAKRGIGNGAKNREPSADPTRSPGLKKAGRPTKYSAAVAQKICDLIAAGKTLKQIDEEPSLPSESTIMSWLADGAHRQFLEQYARAREAYADKLAAETLEIADDSSEDLRTDPKTGAELTDHEVVARSRLRVDTRKWLASKLAPKKYGDKVAVGGADDLPPIRMDSKVTVTPEEAYRNLLDG